MKRGRPRSFKRLLQEQRAVLGITKAEAARRLGVPYRTYQNWELGLRTPRGAFTQRIILDYYNSLIPPNGETTKSAHVR